MCKLTEEIGQMNWNDIIKLENPQDAYDKFIEKFIDLYNKNLPIKKN